MLFLSILVIVLLLFGIGGYYLYYAHSSSSQSGTTYNSTTNTPYSALMQSNIYFAQAQAAAGSGEYAQAKLLYDQALAIATDSTQKGQIEYKLAALEGAYGNPVEAVDLYEQIIGDPTLDSYKQVKAYSVQSMAELYYVNGSTAITREIFKSPPYTSLFVKGNLALSYRHLEEYSTSFYPLALPELRIADWYAFHIHDATSTDGAATSTYPAIITEDLKLANANIDVIKTDSNAAAGIPAILVRKESLYLDLYKDGLVSAQDTEAECQSAVNIFASTGQGSQDGFARYYYAVFLSELGASRATDLQTIVAPFYTGTTYQNSSVISFFTSEEGNLLGQKARIVQIADLAPKFKAFLIQLGWNESDFQ